MKRKITWLVTVAYLLFMLCLGIVGCSEQTRKPTFDYIEFGEEFTVPNTLENEQGEALPDVYEVEVSFEGETIPLVYRQFLPDKIGFYTITYIKGNKRYSYEIECKDTKAPALTFSSEFTGSATYGETYSIPNYTFEDKSEIKERTMAAYDTVTGEELPFINSTTLNVTTKNDIEFRFYAKDIYDNETKYSKTIIVMSFYNDEALKGTNVLSEFSNVDEYPTLVQSAGGYIGNRGSHRIAMKESIEDADVQAGIDDGDGVLVLSRVEDLSADLSRWHSYSVRFANEDVPALTGDFPNTVDYEITMRIYLSSEAKVESLQIWDSGNKITEAYAKNRPYLAYFSSDDYDKWLDFTFRASDFEIGEKDHLFGLYILVGCNEAGATGDCVFIDRISYKEVPSTVPFANDFLSEYKSLTGTASRSYVSAEQLQQDVQEGFDAAKCFATEDGDRYVLHFKTSTNYSTFNINAKEPFASSTQDGTLKITLRVYAKNISYFYLKCDSSAGELNTYKISSLDGENGRWFDLEMTVKNGTVKEKEDLSVISFAFHENPLSEFYISDIRMEYAVETDYEGDYKTAYGISKIAGVNAGYNVTDALSAETAFGVDFASEQVVEMQATSNYGYTGFDFAEAIPLVDSEGNRLKITLELYFTADVNYYYVYFADKVYNQLESIPGYLTLSRSNGTLKTGLNEYTFVVGNGIGSTIGSVNRMILRAHEQISNKQYVGSVRFEYIDDADINGYSPVNGYSAYSWVEKASLTDEEILGGMTGDQVLKVTSQAWTGVNLQFKSLPNSIGDKKLHIQIHLYSAGGSASLCGVNAGIADVNTNVASAWSAIEGITGKGWYTVTFTEGSHGWTAGEDFDSIGFYRTYSAGSTIYIDKVTALYL